MSDTPSSDATVGWGSEVRFAEGADWFAYRPSEIVVVGDQGRDTALHLLESQIDAEPDRIPAEPDSDDPSAAVFYRFRGPFDPLATIPQLAAAGALAQPNHVVFAHGCGCCGPHPAHRWQGCVNAQPMYAQPMYAQPMYAQPMYAQPMYAQPMYAQPMYAQPMYAQAPRRSSALPTPAPLLPPRSMQAPTHVVRVAVLDTGMAADGVRPAALNGMAPPQEHWEVPDEDGDLRLDPAAGHGTFIAGLIDLVAPGCEITVVKELSGRGAGDEVAVADRIHALAGTVHILNLSFGGYAMEHMHLLAAAVRAARAKGTVVVASAGNDGTCRPNYPAALPGVVGVGAIGPGGPAPFTNYGSWVRACAPGVDVVSWFFSEFDGPQVAAASGADPDRFRSWAKWSGTSFAAPMVAAALAREIQTYGVTPAEAVTRVIDGPGLLRLPDLGTVVNVA